LTAYRTAGSAAVCKARLIIKFLYGLAPGLRGQLILVSYLRRTVWSYTFRLGPNDPKRLTEVEYRGLRTKPEAILEKMLSVCLRKAATCAGHEFTLTDKCTVRESVLQQASARYLY